MILQFGSRPKFSFDSAIDYRLLEHSNIYDLAYFSIISVQDSIPSQNGNLSSLYVTILPCIVVSLSIDPCSKIPGLSREVWQR